MKKVILPLFLLLGLAHPASAQSAAFEWPEQIVCQTALANGETAEIGFHMGSDPEVSGISTDAWTIDPERTTLRQTSANDRNTMLEFELSDDATIIGLSVWAQAEDQFGIQVDYSLPDGGPTLPVGNGVCEPLSSEILADAPLMKTLAVFLETRPVDPDPVCYAVSKTGHRISYSIPPTPDGAALFKPISGLPGVGETSMDLIQGTASPEGPPPELTTNLYLIGNGGRTRGTIQIYGQPGQQDWMFISSMTSIDADRDDQVYYAGHCGGEIR